MSIRRMNGAAVTAALCALMFAAACSDDDEAGGEPPISELDGGDGFNDARADADEDAANPLPDAGPDADDPAPDGGDDPEGDGGTDGGDDLPDGGEPPPKSCDRALAIVAGDYFKTNIILANLDGTTLVDAFVSSDSDKPGLLIPLSGDVYVPRIAPASERVVLLDAYGTDVITWMDRDSGDVLAQLSVGSTSFSSNPQDYIEVDDRRAFVSRYESNTTPGEEAFDEGGDLLIVDTQTFAIEGRIPMPEEDAELFPRPMGMTRLGDEIIVTLQRFSQSFDEVGEGRFVGVSPVANEVTWTVDVPGMDNCGRVAVSPSRERLAIACTGKLSWTTWRWESHRSGVVVFDATTSPPTELKRFSLGEAFDRGLQPELAFASETTLFGSAYGDWGLSGDLAFTLDLQTGKHEIVGQSAEAEVFGGIYCAPGCGDLCVMTDADQNQLRRFRLDEDGSFEELDPEPITGLPPRTIGAL